MKTVLFLAYHFPPLGGGGVQRSTKFVRYLPEFGYQPLVITGPGEQFGRWTPQDEDLNSEIPVDVEVHRVPGPEPPASSGWRARAERWFRLKPAFDAWWVEGVARKAERLGSFDLIYTSMRPYATASAAARLSREFGKPWIADLRDPWALDDMMIYPTIVHRRREMARMRTALNSADAIIMNTPEAQHRVLRCFPEFEDRPVINIPNGFDRNDFGSDIPERSDARFRIVHAGQLHTALGYASAHRRRLRRLLRGAAAPVDILPRSHVYLVEAIRRLLQRAPALARGIELHLIGVLTDADRKHATADFVVAHGHLSHSRTVELIRSADLLFLPMHKLPDGVRATVVPGKLYEYLASGRPILAAVPAGDARDLLAESGNAIVCEPDGVNEMTAALERAVSGPRRQGTRRTPSQVFAAYERRNLTKRLASLFDEVLAQARRPT